MKRLVLALLTALLSAAPAAAQSVQQISPVTRNHIPVWVSSGNIGDGGTSAASSISSLGATGPICSNSANSLLAGTTGWNSLCLQANSSGAATISLQNYGTANPQSLNFVINGTSYAFPGSLANITIGTTPVVGGTNNLCLYVSGGVVGQQICTLSAITSLTGDVTATGPGVSAATLAASGVTAGTYGSSTQTPVLTVDAKGRITSATTTPGGITVGSTVVTSGANNGLLYDNGSVLGNLATLSSGVLVTSAGGVPSIATTLPSGLTIPTPAFTGTLTLPDSATWTSTGISKVAALSVGSATLPTGGNVSISGQYQINGTQIAASNLSNGATGSGAVVLAAAPAISGTWTGNAGFSGNITFSGQDINTGTTAPASAGGQTVIMGTIASPTLSNTGQAFHYNTLANGAILQGDGSTNDVSLFNKSGTLVVGIPTGTTKLNFPSLVSGTCSTGLGLDSGNNLIDISCPGAAASIQVGTTTVTSGVNNYVLTSGTGTLANVTEASLLTAGTGITITGTTNATIAVTTPVSLATSASAPTQTSSTTLVQMGLGSTCRFTPTQSGTVTISIFGTVNNVSANTVTTQLTYGTGTAPTNGAAQTGTLLPAIFIATGSNLYPATFTGVITGLTPSTTYWFDTAMKVSAGTGGWNGGTLGCSAIEYP